MEKLEPLVATALRLGAYQIVIEDRVPTSAAVDESVRCIRAAGAERATGLVNAVLRRLADQHADITPPALENDPMGHLMYALSLPEWIATRFLELYGPEEAAALARASNEAPPLAVRVNRLRGDRDSVLADLRTRFPDAAPCEYMRDGLVLGRRGNAALDPAFRDGLITVQDEASQAVIALLDPQPGETVLDTCAAPGGKATGIAERVGESGSVLALDRHAKRLDLVRRATRRLGLTNLACETADANRSLEHAIDERRFDRVLVDAPCSGLGTLRRNPDARWRVRATDPARLAETQLAILRNSAAALRPGGRLVYSTCTLLPEENEGVIEAFLGEAKGFRRVPPERLPDEVSRLIDPDGTLRCFPHRHDADGFTAFALELTE